MAKLLGFPLPPDLENQVDTLLSGLKSDQLPPRREIATAIIQLTEKSVEYYFKDPMAEILAEPGMKSGAIRNAANMAVNTSLRASKVAIPQVCKMLSENQLRQVGKVLERSLFPMP